MNSVREPRYNIQKQIDVYRTILKTKLLSGNVPSQIRDKRWFDISLFHVKFDVNILASSKKNNWKELSVSFSSTKTKSLAENAIRSQNEIEKVLLHLRTLN